MLDDNVSGLVPPLTEDEMAALSAPPRSLTPSPSGSRPQTRVEYRAQADGDLLTLQERVRACREAWNLVSHDNAALEAELAAIRADLETVLGFVERLSALLPDGERPAHVSAALRLRAWMESGQA